MFVILRGRVANTKIEANSNPQGIDNNNGAQIDIVNGEKAGNTLKNSNSIHKQHAASAKTVIPRSTKRERRLCDELNAMINSIIANDDT